ncbi:MAG: serine hydrolase domain-containing protein [Litorimonas sp.]
MTYLKTLLASTLILGLSACSSGADETADPVTAPSFDVAAMDSLLSSAVESGDVIGVQALVFDDGQTVYRNSFGLADRERNTPVKNDTVYRVYSMTKPMTSALIMDLMEEGKLKLTDPASKYIPQLALMKVVSMGEDGQPKYEDQARPMTVEDLLLHRSGMAYGIFGGNPIEEAWQAAGLFDPQTAMAENMDKMPMLPLLGQPGEQWFYSYSIDILGRIAEVITGQTLGEAFKERFFDPLGMTETSFQVSAELKPRFASNYFLQEDGSFGLAEDGQTSPFTMPGKFESGGGGLTSTTDDWLKFARMLLNEGEYEGARILEPETVRLMMTDHLGDTPTLLPWIGGETGAGFGYGGSVQMTSTPEQEAASGRYPGQFGWGGAARTNFWVDPKNDAIGIIMLQMFSAEDPQIHADFQALALAETRDDK